MRSNQVHFEMAQLDDADEITTLINNAYRGEGGWTDERAWVDGPRLSVAQVRSQIKDRQGVVYVHRRNDIIVATIHASIAANEAYITSLAVHPYVQQQGVGDAALKKLEVDCRNLFGVTLASISILSPREDVLQYLIRRGYEPMDYVEPFPEHMKMGQPKDATLQLAYLVKPLH